MPIFTDMTAKQQLQGSEWMWKELNPYAEILVFACFYTSYFDVAWIWYRYVCLYGVSIDGMTHKVNCLIWKMRLICIHPLFLCINNKVIAMTPFCNNIKLILHDSSCLINSFVGHNNCSIVNLVGRAALCFKTFGLMPSFPTPFL